MRDLYLRFTDAEEMKLALQEFGFQEEVDQGGLHYPEICLDVVGVMYEPTSMEEEHPETIALPGYHANMRVVNDLLDMTALNDFIVTPKTPARVWA